MAKSTLINVPIIFLAVVNPPQTRSMHVAMLKDLKRIPQFFNLPVIMLNTVSIFDDVKYNTYDTENKWK